MGLFILPKTSKSVLKTILLLTFLKPLLYNQFTNNSFTNSYFYAKFRLLLIEVIEKIEISIRIKLVYHLPPEVTPCWFQNFDLFIDSMVLVKNNVKY
ncbi:Abi family protein [Hwangdonia lutea]|uniref:Uncharacterized protein n=1 Tax=Hwangdonia lutea TaxID=3075823 RepID=A0AA97EN76_9FLAO|nr:Abi family protein [Hwangdonia sp. SCSIO 19198]WOD43165.1 hypothetical protein RNZ46_14330 [Hwangdonia sp. SCSIO 19198]